MNTFEIYEIKDDYLGDVILILITILLLIKTFFYLRIFESISYIVTMIRIVLYDLRVFMCFYMLQILMFSVVFGILRIG